MRYQIKHVALILFATLWGGLLQAADGLMVDNAWIREAPPGATALAGYMTLHNHGDRPRVLSDAYSDAFGNVMLHRTVMEGGMAKMVPQKGILIPAGGSLVFEPNGYHLMLMKPERLFKAGEQVAITLEFQDGESLTVTHTVRSALVGMDGMEGMGGMDHGHMQH